MAIAYARNLESIETDVLVCGTGCAGIGAAVAAARGGARVLAVDRCGFAGGFFTAIIGSAFDGFTDQRTGRPVVGGVVFEMLERMGVIPPGSGPTTRFTATGEYLDREKHPDWRVATCDPERFKRAADELLTETGVHLLYHTQVSDVIRQGERIEAVIVSNKAGLTAIRPNRTLLPNGVENLLVAGRCHSATSRALASSRVTATAARSACAKQPVG